MFREVTLELPEATAAQGQVRGFGVCGGWQLLKIRPIFYGTKDFRSFLQAAA
jgi:hypothetical protein